MNQHVPMASRSSNNSLTEANGLSTGPVPMEPYRSPAFYALEQERVFRRSWLMMGRVEELPKPGSYIVKEVEVCNASVLVTRAKDGAIRAFHNVCSHRGNQVVLDDHGTASRFVCRYHNWTYANDGNLLGIPDESQFFSVDKKKCGLTPIAAEVWEGFVFINLSPVPEVSLTEFLGDFGEYLAGLKYTAAEHPVVFVAELDCNWKVVSDAFSESYHIPAIHPQTIGDTFASKSNPFAHLLDAKIFGPHRVNSMFGNSQYEAKPNSLVERLGQAAMATGNAISAVSADTVSEFLSHPAVNPTGSADWSMDVNHVFPNTHIDSGQGGFFVHQYWPLSYNRTRHEARFYISPPTNVVERFRVEQYIARVCEVLLEDLTNVARTQKGLESRAKDFMQLQDNEILLRHGIDMVEKWVAAETVREAMA
ncbi:aromatic ring-hydroxylating oxygenase subunit alpha [Sphingomonas profundi]|uniref:aromatic ring-hydroxylating oxygenase subunit alpha n=1 Tax=Alterirhizorhabdus profundi TaxID=2681549 RepID=UPI0012E7A497|nr:aromatic ring-hydroxylating dioxygenase subunit alpha [Sphingomonas profundi]